MPFSIEFLDQPYEYLYDDPTTPAAIGRIVLGEFEEEFASSLYTWSKLDYQRQWRSALHSLLNGAHKTALIVEYVDPHFSNHLQWWPLYRVDDAVFVQNHLLFYEDVEKPFNINGSSSFLRDRRTVNEDGQTISEWSVGMAEVERFAQTFLAQAIF